MKALIVTLNKENKLIPSYQVFGPLNADEASRLTKEAYLVILLCDSTEAKRNREEYNKFMSCVSGSPLKCRKELQIKTLEYVTGSLLSEMVSIESFPETTRINFLGRIGHEEISTSDETVG